MSIDWPNFTWHTALAGGLLIGLASAALLLMNGKIAGVSGILGGLLRLPRQGQDRGWRIAFVIGLLLAPGLYQLSGQHLDIQVESSWPLLLLSGLLVGFGTRLGSGCTSGHGICGLARNAPRSWAATLTFMLTAILTVYISRHLLGGTP